MKTIQIIWLDPLNLFRGFESINTAYQKNNIYDIYYKGELRYGANRNYI